MKSFLTNCSTVFRLLLSLSVAWLGVAFATVDLNQSFSPINVNPGTFSVLTIDFYNSNIANATGVSFNHNLPSNVVVANPPQATNSCGGTFNPSQGATSLSLGGAGATIPGGNGSDPGRCTISVRVVSSVSGTYINTIPVNAVSSSEGGNPVQSQATLAVSAPQNLTPSISVSPSPIYAGGTSTVTLRLTNPNPYPLTGAAFTGAIAADLQYNSLLTNGCGGSFSSASASSFTLSGGTIPASSFCEITFSVLAPIPSPHTHLDANRAISLAAGAVTTSQGSTNSSAVSTNIRVRRGVEIAKAFSVNPIVTGATSTLTITLRNNTLSVINGYTFTDTFPSGMTVASPLTTSQTPAGCAGTLLDPSSGTLGPGDTGIRVSGSSVLGASTNGSNQTTCVITIAVTATTSATAATTYTNQSSNFSGVNFGTPLASIGSASLVVNPVQAVRVSKSFSPSTIVQSQVSTLTILLFNNTATAASITSFTDNLLTMGAGITVAPAPVSTTTCGGTPIALPGATTVSMTSGTIPPNGSCEIRVPVVAAAGAATGTRTNTVAANGLQTSQGNNVLAATANLVVNRALNFQMSFSPSTTNSGGRSRLTYTITRNAGASALTGVAFNDIALPSGMTIADIPNIQSNCGGSLTADPNTTSVSLSGAAVAAPGGVGVPSNCTISLDVQTSVGTSTLTNDIPNTAGQRLTTAEGFVFDSAISAALARVSRTLQLNKSFSPTSINGGQPATLSILIANNRPNALQLTRVAVTDNLPTGIQVFSVPNASVSGTGCSSATISANPGAFQTGISNLTINAGSTCTFSVRVTSTLDGNLVNTLPIGAVSSFENVSNDAAASATLNISRRINIGKGFDPAFIETGANSTLTLTIFNTNTTNRTGANPAFTDTLPVGLSIVGTPTTTCAGGVVSTGLSGSQQFLSLIGGTFPAGSTCSVSATVTASSAGVYNNTIPIGTLQTLEGGTNADPGIADLTVLNKPSIAIGFAPASIGVGNTSTLTFTLTNPNSAALLPTGLTGVNFNIPLVNTTIAPTVVVGGTCTGVSHNATALATSFAVTAATIPPASSCTITLLVSSSVLGTHAHTTSGVLSNQTQTPSAVSNTALLQVLQRPTINKSFSPSAVGPGGVSTLTFTLTNPNAVGLSWSAVAFSDEFPTTPGPMTVAATPAVFNDCGGILRDYDGNSLAANDVGLQLQGGSLGANSSCQVRVNVTATVLGTYTNTSSVLSSSNAGDSLSAASAALIAVPLGISGTVFEDVNYGGGLGRIFSVAEASAVASGWATGAIRRPNVRLELYNASGNFVATTTTDATGAYIFSLSSSGAYTVRVVSSSVTSSRSGGSSCSSCLPIQTFRVNAGSADPNRVGGENPTLEDAPNGSTTLAALNSSTTTAQSVATVNLGATNVTDVDFGFNFSTVVSTRDSGQGSLRQFILNANALGDRNKLIQAGSRKQLNNTNQTLPSQTESSIFMIPLASLSSSSGQQFARITPTTAFPTLTAALVFVDGTTQSVNIGDTNPGTQGIGGTVGVDNLSLPQIHRPEVELASSGTVANALILNGSSQAVRGLALVGFNAAAISVQPSASSALIEQNYLGSGAVSFALPSTPNSTNILIADAANGTTRHNLIGFSTNFGVLGMAASNWLVSANEVRANASASSSIDGISFESLSSSTRIEGNLVIANGGVGIDSWNASGSFIINNNTVSGNGILNGETPGVRLWGSSNRVEKNLIFNNYGAGVLVQPASTQNRITQNSIYGNGTISGSGSAAPTGQIGIDLLATGEDEGKGVSPFVTLNSSSTSGANALYNYPILADAQIIGSTLVITGFSKPGAIIELFIADPDPSGFGEGKTYLVTLIEGSLADLDSTTGAYSGLINGRNQGSDSSANRFRFEFAVPGGVVVGTQLTATATNALGATSEFSGMVTVRPGLSIAGVVFSDLNRNGIRDAGEPAVAGATLTLGGASSASALSNSSGNYSFSNLGSGSYTVTLTVPAGYLATTPIVQAVSLSSAPRTDVNFALFNGYRLSGVVFRDDGRSSGTANNAIQDGGEPGMGAVLVSVVGSATLSTTTDANGIYELFVPAGFGAVQLSHSQAAATGSNNGSVVVLASSFTDSTARQRNLGTPSNGQSYAYNFGVVWASEFTPDQSGQTTSPGIITYQHFYRPATLGAVSLTIAGGLTYQVRRAANCTNLTASDSSQSVPLSFTVTSSWPRDPDGRLSRCVLEVSVLIPAGQAGGLVDIAQVRTNLTWLNNPVVTESRVVIDTTTILSLGSLRLEKVVRNITQNNPAGSTNYATNIAGKPGDTLEYCIAFRNLGTTNLTNAILSDPVPFFTNFVSGSLRLGSTTLSDAIDLDVGEFLSGSNFIRVRLGTLLASTFTLAPGATGTVCYRVTIR